MKKIKAFLIAGLLVFCVSTPVLADSPRIWSRKISVTLPRWGGQVTPTAWVTKVSWDEKASFYFTYAKQWLKANAYVYCQTDIPLWYGVQASEGEILYTDAFNTEVYPPYIKWYSYAKSNSLEPNETKLEYYFSPDIKTTIPPKN